MGRFRANVHSIDSTRIAHVWRTSNMQQQVPIMAIGRGLSLHQACPKEKQETPVPKLHSGCSTGSGHEDSPARRFSCSLKLDKGKYYSLTRLLTLKGSWLVDVMKLLYRTGASPGLSLCWRRS